MIELLLVGYVLLAVSLVGVFVLPMASLEAGMKLTYFGHVRLARACLAYARVTLRSPQAALLIESVRQDGTLYAGASPRAPEAVRGLLVRVDPGTDAPLAGTVLNSCMNVLIAGGAYRDAAAVGLAWPDDARAAVAALPYAPLLEINRAEALYNQGEWERALAHLDARPPPDGAPPVVRGGYAMQRAWILGSLGRGREGLDAAAAVSPDDVGVAYRAEVHFTRARCHLACGAPDAAAAEVAEGRRVARRPSSLRNAELLLARVALARGDLVEAAARCRAAAASPWTGQPGDGLLLWGEVLEALGDPEGAARAWADAVARDAESEAAAIARRHLDRAVAAAPGA